MGMMSRGKRVRLNDMCFWTEIYLSGLQGCTSLQWVGAPKTYLAISKRRTLTQWTVHSLPHILVKYVCMTGKV